MKKIEYTLRMWYNGDMNCKQMTTGEVRKQLNRRIRKKKGLLKENHYNELKKEIFKKMEEKVAQLEQEIKNVN